MHVRLYKSPEYGILFLMVDEILRKIQHNWRLYIYALSGLGLCWIDLWRGIGNGAQWAFAVNCTGFCILPFIIFRFDWTILWPDKQELVGWHKFFRICFYIWGLLFVILAYPVFIYFAPGTDYNYQTATAIANVGIYVAVVIRLFFSLLYEKKAKITPVFAIWSAFCIFAILSINESLWPLWFFSMFGSFYLAPLKRGEPEEILEGIVSGMLIGFFWIQSRAFLYRPYDLSPRYRGHYTNENVNAMFYMTTYIAWLIKMSIYRIRKNTKPYVIAFLFASSMWAFVFITGCRSVMLGFIGITFFYWIIESRFIGKNVLRTFLARVVLMGICAVISFLPVFICARYIPPLRHHPIWYGSEYCEESVMSWDPIDSPKYMELEDVLETGLGRFNPFH